MFINIIGLLTLLCTVYVIYDVWANQKYSMSDGNKLLWTIFAILFSVITAIIYLLTVKQRR